MHTTFIKSLYTHTREFRLAPNQAMHVTSSIITLSQASRGPSKNCVLDTISTNQTATSYSLLWTVSYPLHTQTCPKLVMVLLISTFQGKPTVVPKTIYTHLGHNPSLLITEELQLSKITPGKTTGRG